MKDAPEQPTPSGLLAGPLSPPPADNALSDLLDLIVNMAVATVPDVHAASVSLLTGPDGQVETASSTSAAVEKVDAVQYRAMSGPCMSALQTGEEVNVTVPVEPWPEFSEVATGEGVRAVRSLPLRVLSRTVGALNLYSMTGRLWEGPVPGTARLLADQATFALGHAAALADAHHMNSNLREALVTRTVIGQAQGILMARQGITADEAFNVLRRASQRSNRKLRDIAADIVGEVARH